jgi:hypothetical protein
MGVTSFTIAMFPRELPRAVFRKRLTSNMKGSQASLAQMGERIVQTAEKAAESPIPKFSGKERIPLLPKGNMCRRMQL